MPLWPSSPAAVPRPIINVVGSELSALACLINAVGPGAPVNGTLGAGIAILYPLLLPDAYVPTKGWWRNGSTGLAGSIQVGVYSSDFALIGASDQVVQAGVDAIQEAPFSTPVTIPRGACYVALATSGLGNLSAYSTFGGTTAVALQLAKATGSLLVLSGAFPLPATLTPGVTTAGAAFICGIANRSLVA